MNHMDGKIRNYLTAVTINECKQKMVVPLHLWEEDVHEIYKPLKQTKDSFVDIVKN